MVHPPYRESIAGAVAYGMDDAPSDNVADLEALESLVLEGDDLASLEASIGRFNVFHALGVARAEIRHSAFLAWMLAPSESHGLGDLFLKPVLLDLLRAAPREARPVSPARLDGAADVAERHAELLASDGFGDQPTARRSVWQLAPRLPDAVLFRAADLMMNSAALRRVAQVARRAVASLPGRTP